MAKILSINLIAPVAQLDRVIGYEPIGQGFESLRVRHSIFFQIHAPVAQLDRVIGYEPIGQGFESLRVRHSIFFQIHAPVAQLDRVIGYEPIGQGFESLRVRHSFFSSTCACSFSDRVTCRQIDLLRCFVYCRLYFSSGISKRPLMA